MARTKSRFRQIFNMRFLRWWAARQLVAICPPLGRWLAFFPHPIDLIDAADRILVNTREQIPPETLALNVDFLRQCAAWDSTAEVYDPPRGAITGQRSVLIRRAWIDMSNGSILLPDRRRTVTVRLQKANWNATSIVPFRHRVRITGRVFAPIPTRNYFHNLLENFARTLEMLEVRGIAGQPLTIAKLPPITQVEDAYYSGLALLYPDLEIRDFSSKSLIIPDEVVGHFPPDTQWEWAPFGDATPDRLVALFRAVYGSATDARHPGKLYLSRTGTKLRALRNEPELARALSERGFSSFVATDRNHAEQIARFRSARIIVATHGAGLANLIFATPGTTVIEIFPKNFVKSTFWWIARRRQLTYIPILGGDGDYDQHFEVNVADVTAPLSGL